MERTQHDPRVAPHISYNRFGPYEIESILGQGAVAVVYAAKDRTGKSLVLKVLTRPAAAQAPIRLGFQREYRTLSKLRHRNIVQVFGTGEVDGYFYIAMERITGETLDGFLLRSKKLGESAAIGITRQVAGALDYLHGRGFVHRDIKPGNLLLGRDGRIVLFDFGTVLDMENPDPEQTTGVYGTPAFLAPEQIRDDTTIDGRADLYALGVLLFLMVTGRKPFYGGRNEVLEAHLQTPPPRPSEFAHVSPDLERVILKSLAKDPAERYQTGAEFIAALDDAELTPEPDNALTGRLRRLFGG